MVTGISELTPLRFATHSKFVQNIAIQNGWLPAARYTNLRDVRTYERVGFIDINWKSYDFERHLAAVKSTRPHMTVALDVERIGDVNKSIDQAHELSLFSDKVIIVPKCLEIEDRLEEIFPPQFLFGYSTPTKYGGTLIKPSAFKRQVHILGGAPHRQLEVAKALDVYSFDCNRFTLDARFGDYFDGQRFRPHPIGGYGKCIEASILSINDRWSSYEAPTADAELREVAAA